MTDAASVLNHSIFDQIARGAPLVVMLMAVGMAVIWRRMIERERAWDLERTARHEEWTAERKLDLEVRERMVREVVAVVTINNEIQKGHSKMIAELISAIGQKSDQTRLNNKHERG